MCELYKAGFLGRESLLGALVIPIARYLLQGESTEWLSVLDSKRQAIAELHVTLLVHRTAAPPTALSTNTRQVIVVPKGLNVGVVNAADANELYLSAVGDPDSLAESIADSAAFYDGDWKTVSGNWKEFSVDQLKFEGVGEPSGAKISFAPAFLHLLTQDMEACRKWGLRVGCNVTPELITVHLAMNVSDLAPSSAAACGIDVSMPLVLRFEWKEPTHYMGECPTPARKTLEIRQSRDDMNKLDGRARLSSWERFGLWWPLEQRLAEHLQLGWQNFSEAASEIADVVKQEVESLTPAVRDILDMFEWPLTDRPLAERALQLADDDPDEALNILFDDKREQELRTELGLPPARKLASADEPLPDVDAWASRIVIEDPLPLVVINSHNEVTASTTSSSSSSSGGIAQPPPLPTMPLSPRLAPHRVMSPSPLAATSVPTDTSVIAVDIDSITTASIAADNAAAAKAFADKAAADKAAADKIAADKAAADKAAADKAAADKAAADKAAASKATADKAAAEAAAAKEKSTLTGVIKSILPIGGNKTAPDPIASRAKKLTIEKTDSIYWTSIEFLRKTLNDITQRCVICNDLHPLETSKPTICAKQLCSFQFTSFGLGVDVEREILVRPEIVDMLICFTAAGTLQPDRFNPFPDVQRRVAKVDMSFNSNPVELRDALIKMPTLTELARMVRSGKLRTELETSHPLLYLVLRWIVSTTLAHIELLTDKTTPPRWSQLGKYQFIMRCAAPAREAQFREHCRKHGSFFVWHGSGLGNWHNIVRTGLKNMSGTAFQSSGAAYGPGIYAAEDSGTSYGYSGNTNNPWMHSMYGNGARTLALCEVVDYGTRIACLGKVHRPACLHSTSSPYYRIEEEEFIMTRFFIVMPADEAMPNINAKQAYDYFSKYIKY